MMVFFFFQAEDGIRDVAVTGVQTCALPILMNNQLQFSPSWLGTLTLEASGFHHTKLRNSEIGQALNFPFTVSFLTTSGLETFGDNQFATAITAFPIERDQQKYQFRYDVSRAAGRHAEIGRAHV